MLQSLENIRKYKIHAQNGDVGRVEDFYFDNKRWTTSFLVANCGNWVMGHQKVLIAPRHFAHADHTEGRLYLNLTQKQVEASAGFKSHYPISKQHVDNKIFTPVSHEFEDKEEESSAWRMANPEDANLCSLKDTEGLHIQALDGEIGHVSDLMVNDESWEIVWMVVNTRNWLPGKYVMISPDMIRNVDWPKRRVYLNLTREEIRNSHP